MQVYRCAAGQADYKQYFVVVAIADGIVVYKNIDCQPKHGKEISLRLPQSIREHAEEDEHLIYCLLRAVQL